MLHDTFIQIALTLLVALLVHLALRASINHIVRRVVRSHHYKSKTDAKKREKTLRSVFDKALGVVVWVVAVIVILALLHVNLAALLTGAGVFGVIIGFGAQNTLKDYLAGIFIIAENQYRVGDIVVLTVGGKDVGGVVEELTVRITQLRDLDGNLHTVPNGTPSMVSNLSFGFANVNVDFRVGYNTDLDKAREIMDQVGAEQAASEQWKDSIIEPIKFLRVDSLDESAVILKAVGKVAPASQWDLASDFRVRIKQAFDKNGITIPYNQLVIHQAAPAKKKG